MVLSQPIQPRLLIRLPIQHFVPLVYWELAVEWCELLVARHHLQLAMRTELAVGEFVVVAEHLARDLLEPGMYFD